MFSVLQQYGPRCTAPCRLPTQKVSIVNRPFFSFKNYWEKGERVRKGILVQALHLSLYVMQQPCNLIKVHYVDEKVDFEHEGQSDFASSHGPGSSVTESP